MPEGMGASHHFVEHTSEVELHLSAPSFSALLAEAGRALGELMLRGHEGGFLGEPEEEIEVHGRDEVALLVGFLNELVYHAEASRLVPLASEMLRVGPSEGEEGMALRARLRFAELSYAPSKVKAATFHGVRVVEAEGGVTANVILDV